MPHAPAPARPTVPPVLYLPSDGTTTASGEAQVVLRTTRDGRTALLAYTALDRLVTCCGPAQPWLLVPTEQLSAINSTQPYDVVYLDLDIPEEHRHRGELGA
ncbi:hypothetical protein J4G33_15220 [Actinotalea sp. BY-33]|uniref:SseB protein N-terminal domain-containing protein n=1 Tax=Actinotalea soli TaxID=2819234 RepID=A0A939RW80_9CELL|nr:SAV_915 family protein [Actinotalea soli]MBO1753160.1 hypothetical protein [Actinotalea soli]